MNTNGLQRFTLSEMQNRQNVLDKARLDPVLIQGHYTDYVLMSKQEYESLIKAPVPEPRIGSPDLDILIPALAKMAQVGR
ncbi:hypothetical protein CcrColossus_gp055 [Caulobacter phage CcrColossus]|uniref:Uncharacterized protein n=1 Tax=Caulobacter phage CcrColossus TaxID=1211640 RepID=K4JUC1_9CAUD|nr:hypothetical protein CcrColossus_gp055 [Caulobacter phage CcrColossus]AFU87925.1 hypothetical protein CcrColossus_gp055 [Caulobacter phage CcrColossus]